MCRGCLTRGRDRQTTRVAGLLVDRAYWVVLRLCGSSSMKLLKVSSNWSKVHEVALTEDEAGGPVKSSIFGAIGRL